MSFEQEIDEWINLDNEIKRVSEHITKLKERKSNLQDKIISYAKQTKTEKIRYVVTNTFQPLTFTYINKCLEDIIKNKDQVNQIINYIKRKREIKVIEDIKRIYNK
jgi:tartrate dehydratase beta subunit/fumarate hydratase class I family protein